MAGRFGSAGGGLARGLLAGTQVRQQGEQLKAAKAAAATKAFQSALDKSVKMHGEMATAAAKARGVGRDVTPLRKAAMMALAPVAQMVEQHRAAAAAAGLDPNTASPITGEQFIQQHMSMFDVIASGEASPEERREIAVGDAEAMLPVEAAKTRQNAQIGAEVEFESDRNRADFDVRQAAREADASARAQESSERRMGDFRVTQAARESAARSSGKVRVEGRPTTGPERDRNRLIDLRMMERSGSLSARETEEKKLLEGQLTDEDGTLDFGGSLIGKQHALLNNLRRVYRQTGSLTPEQQDAAKSAMHILRMPHRTNDANGNLVEIIPGIPPHLQELFAPTGTAPDESDVTLTPDDVMDLPSKDSMTVSVSDSGSEVITLSEKDADWKGNIENALTHIKGAVDLLNGTGGKERASAGFMGAVKSITNPIARQMGIPAESATEQLKRKLALLSTVMAPIITNERRITDTERTRVDKLVGQIGVLEDEVAIREILIEIVMFIQSKQGGQK